MKSPPKYTIKNTPKQLIFSRQVINNKRGCYRWFMILSQSINKNSIIKLMIFNNDIINL